MNLRNKRDLIRDILPQIMIFLCVLIIIPNCALSKEEKEDFAVKAKIWEYDTLCNFKEPANLPKALRYSTGRFVSEGCEPFKKKHGHPQAICITYANFSDSDLEIPIEGLSNIILTTKNGKKLSALAFQHFTQTPLGSGYEINFMTEIHNTLTIVINSKEMVDVIFLFQKDSSGDIVQIGKMNPVTIQ